MFYPKETGKVRDECRTCHTAMCIAIWCCGKETKDLQKERNWIRYQIGGKMFAAVCMDENNEPYYITLKLETAEGDQVPCEIWRKTKDPTFTEEEFERNIQERVNRLKRG